MSKGFGILPQYEKELPFDTLDPVEFLIVALEAARSMDCSFRFVSRSGFVADTSPAMFSSGETISLRIRESSALVRSESKGKKLIDTNKNKKNIALFEASLSRCKERLHKIDIHHKFEEWAPRFSEDNAPVPVYNKPAGFDFLNPFTPVKGYTVSPILVLFNVLVFIVMCLAGANPFWPDGELMIDWGANFKPSTLDGEWWRLVAANFLHFGIVHLFFNMTALIYIGRALEPLLGGLKFLLAYLLTGLTSSVLSLYWHDDGVSAGASGAIFGMYGVFFALLTTNLVEKEVRKPTLQSIGGFIVYNLLFGAAIGIVDNAGHLGGLFGGLFLGYCYYPLLIRPRSKALQTTVLTLSITVILAVTVFSYKTIPNPLGIYFKTMEAFDRNEGKALEKYNTAAAFRDAGDVKEGIRLWDDNLKLLESLKGLDLSRQVKQRNELLRIYCEVRKSSFELFRRELLLPSKGVDPMFDHYDKRITNILDSIRKFDEGKLKMPDK